MTSLPPRLVLVTRETELQALMARHATLGQVRFHLDQHGQNLDLLQARHDAQARAMTRVRAALPQDWTFAEVTRAALDRFLFAEGDIVVALGQDGLVANLAKYLAGQPVIGVTPDPATYEGVLTTHETAALAELLPRVATQRADTALRTMVEARVEGQGSLVALNEIFVGHRSHQSARYELDVGGKHEFQSSSGLILATGTGMTGWAKSIREATHDPIELGPQEAAAAFFVREPWPSRHSGATLRSGRITATDRLTLSSRINEGGVIFADGIEQDFLTFDWGNVAELGLAALKLHLVV